MARPSRRGSGSQETQGATQQREGRLTAEQEAGEPTRSRRTFRPLVDIYEADEGLVVLADVPGADPNGIAISLEGRELILRAEVDEDAPERMSVLHREYEIGDYERRFQLSGDVDVENIRAELKHGLLKITIPKAPEPQARRIEVRSNG